jgi:uncharacterized membrane protein
MAVAGVTGVDVFTAMKAARGEPTRTASVREAITVNRPPADAYELWRDFANLPAFMTHVDEVEVTGPRSSRWTVRAPGRRHVQWDAEIVEDRTGEVIAWRSVGQSAVTNSGKVQFVPAPSGDGTEVGTEVHVRLDYHIPFGAAGRAISTLFGEHPDQQVRDDLRRFKQVMETGEVLRSEGSPEGTRALRHVTQQPARPAAVR